MNREERREAWLQILERQRSSGKSVAAFCRSEKISTATFYQWRNRLRMLDAGDTSLVPVKVVNTNTCDSVLIELPCGATVRVPSEERSLRQVLRVLLQIKAGD